MIDELKKILANPNWLQRDTELSAFLNKNSIGDVAECLKEATTHSPDKTLENISDEIEEVSMTLDSIKRDIQRLTKN